MGGRVEFGLNSASLCYHPEGLCLICRRTGTAMGPVALTLAHKAKNITLISQSSSTVMSGSVLTGWYDDIS